MTRNSKVLEGLLRVSAEGRLHHAYVLSGPATQAKIDCVERFTVGAFAAGAGLFAAGAGEAEERVLARIRARSHPDFRRIEEVGEDKSAAGLLEQVRELSRVLSFPPLELSRRVVLIPDAASLGASSFNSILKILEEPPAHSMFFLLCRDPSELLPTIVSRCQVLRFAPLSDEEMLAFLGEKGATDAEALLGWSEGATERAELLLGGDGAREVRRDACERLLDLWDASPRIPSVTAQWLERLEGEERAQVAVESWELLLRDLAYVAAGASRDQVRFPSLHERLAHLAGRGASLPEIGERASAINRFRVYRRLNGNLRLDLAALLGELQIFSVGKAASPT